MNDKCPSAFVNIVAWVFIVLSSFASIVGLLQNLVLLFFFPRDNFYTNETMAGELPAVLLFMFEHFELLFLGFFLIALITLTASIALLKRREWGRKLFIAILIFLILWQIISLIFGWVFVHSMNTEMGLHRDEFGAQFRAMQITSLLFNIMIAAALSALFGWIIKRLRSQPIRSEFL